MTIWVVRAGRYGEREDKALEEGYVFIGWGRLADLSAISDREDLRRLISETYTDRSPKVVANHTGQIWSFVTRIKKGDIAALPLKSQPAIAFGEVIGDYEHNPDNPEDARHCRRVKWIGDPIKRVSLDSDLRFSFGSALTVFRVHRNNAEDRIRAMLSKPGEAPVVEADDGDVDIEPPIDLTNAASQQISDFIGQKFRGRKMEELVKAILEAKGYEAEICPMGADEGVDILAGRGAMGFDAPSLCVQVKSGDSPVSREVLDQLQGVMQKFNAEHGLLVSWGGFKSTVETEARRSYFNVRLWNDQKLVEELQDVYEKLPKEIQADLPLKQTWALVEER